MTDEELDVFETVLREGWAIDSPITKIDMEFLASAADAIATLRAQLSEARADIAKRGRALNVAKYGQPDFSWEIHKMALQEAVTQRDHAEAERDAAQAAADSWKNRAMHQNEVSNREAERADRAEAERTAQIEAKTKRAARLQKAALVFQSPSGHVGELVRQANLTVKFLRDMLEQEPPNAP